MKNELRKKFKSVRKCIENKEESDKLISELLFNSDVFKNAELILCYVSFNNEVDTIGVIAYCLKHNKQVAVPYCVDIDGHMDFYYIHTLNDLIAGSFGIREPDINRCQPVDSFDNALLIVPALSFDKKGYRLGYGKGYYDRFLEKHNLKSVGLCYNQSVSNQLPVDKYDKAVDFVITESSVINCNNGGKNG